MAIASYIGVFLLVITLVLIGYQPPVRDAALATAATDTSSMATANSGGGEASVDRVVATNLASSLAETADLPISNDVSNLSQSLEVESLLAQTETNTISKPQIVEPSSDSRTTVKYKTVEGDTVKTVSEKFSLSETTIKWANNLTGNNLSVGKTLTIPPVDGILYTVRSGDTIDTIASRYKSDRARIVAYNNLELSGNPSTGTKIIIPDGNLPVNERPGYIAAPSYANGINYSEYSGGYGSAYQGGASVGNRYAIGQCTWYAYERRLQLGKPVGGMWGNAYSWAYMARAAGYRVNGTPSAGAVMQNGGGYGHVSIVESVKPGVSITISEMNGYRFGGGWNRVGNGTISWSEAVSGRYQYIH